MSDPAAGRLARLRERLNGIGASTAVLTDPVSIAWLTGFRANPHERLMALAVTPGSAVLVVPALEVESARAVAAGVEVTGWRDGEDGHALLARGLDGASEVAVEKGHLTLAGLEALEGRAGSLRVLDAGPVLRDLRARKEPGELELLRRAAELTDAVAAQVLASLRPGDTEAAVADRVARAVAEGGGTLSFSTLVQSGPNSAQPHLAPTSRRLEAGDLVLLDMGAAWSGWKADITRCAVVGGEPDARQQELHDHVLAAHDAALAAVRPGVTAGQVDAAARAVLEAAGLGAAFVHRVGHGLGLEAHEHPSLDPGSPTVLEPGMVVTVEPGAYLPGWGGVRIEDDVAVTAEGAELLTHAPHGLRWPS